MRPTVLFPLLLLQLLLLLRPLLLLLRLLCCSWRRLSHAWLCICQHCEHDTSRWDGRVHESSTDLENCESCWSCCGRHHRAAPLKLTPARLLLTLANWSGEAGAAHPALVGSLHMCTAWGTAGLLVPYSRSDKPSVSPSTITNKYGNTHNMNNPG